MLSHESQQVGYHAAPPGEQQAICTIHQYQQIAATPKALKELEGGLGNPELHQIFGKRSSTDPIVFEHEERSDVIARQTLQYRRFTAAALTRQAKYAILG
ncbi:hypothetical protein LH20_00720 [Sphingopyxis sp. 113P3]|nr:hypothetical protein LH20_00720 [Sphingopyxis sp. 113P3]